MLVLQVVTLWSALCIFSLQAKHSHGEATASEHKLHSMTLNEKWQQYGCKNTPKLEKPFGKLELCLGTMVNQLIFRILQNYSPTPLPEHLIISTGKRGFEDQIRKYIATYLPQMSADEKKQEHVFDQVNEYIFSPLIKYLDQFPMHVLAPQEQAIIDSRREEIANILKKYMKEPLNPVVPVTASSFQENLPAIIRYLTRYAPGITENLDVLTLLLYRIKKDGFKEIEARDLSKLPKKDYDKIVSKVSDVINQHKKPADRLAITLPYFIHDFQSFKPWLFRHFETYIPELFADKLMLKKVLKQIEEIFEGIEPNNVTSDNINGLDKNVLLQFVEKYYPEQFGDQVFVDELVQNYDAQPKSNVMPMPGTDNNRIKNALLYFFKNVYPKLTLDEQFVEQFAENFEINRRNEVDPTVEVPDFETGPPIRDEIMELVKEELMRTTDSTVAYIISNENLDVPATTPVPEVEFIPVVKQKLVIDHIPEEPSADSDISEGSESESIIIASDTVPTPSEQKTIQDKILECIKEMFPEIYANKADLAEVLKQLESNISPGNEEALSLEKQIRKFSNAHVPKTAVDESDTSLNIPEKKVIEIDITPETKQPSKTVEKFYIVKGTANGAATVSLSNLKPDANAVRPGAKVIEIDIAPETKQSGKSVEKVYIVKGNGGAAKVSLSNIKPNQKAVVNVEVSGKIVRRSNNQNSIHLKPNNAFGTITRDNADKYRQEYRQVIKNYLGNTYRNKQHFKQPKMETPKVHNVKVVEVLQPATDEYDDRLKEHKNKIHFSQPEIETPNVENVEVIEVLQPATDEYDDRLKEHKTSTNGKLGSMEFAHEHNFIPRMMRSYAPLYEKELRGETLTKEEDLEMKALEAIFAKDDQAEKYRKEYVKTLNYQEDESPNEPNFSQPEIETPNVENTQVIEVLHPETNEYNDRLNEHMPSMENEKLGSMKFSYDHKFFPLMIRSYAPLYEKELEGEPLTKEERSEMKVLEAIFAQNDRAEKYRQEYVKTLTNYQENASPNELEFAQTKLETPNVENTPVIEVLNPETEEYDDRLKEYVTSMNNRKKLDFAQPKIETPKGQNVKVIEVLHPATDEYDDRLTEYMTNMENEEKLTFSQPKIETPKVKNVKIIEVLHPAKGEHNNRLNEHMTSMENERLGSIEFAYEHNFFPLMVRAYGPLYEKELQGEPLTKEERLKMIILETMFEKNQSFRQLYHKKFGPEDTLDIKAMLYKMYKTDLKENGNKFIQIDPMKNVKFQKLDHANLQFFDDQNNDEYQTETIES